MPPGIHSKLGPSKSESWINCPPCLKLTEDMEDEPSEYASAGTAAHELAEYKGKKILGLKAGSRPYSDYDSDEMEECTDMYADYLKELYDQAKLICQDPVTLFEQHVEMDNYAPGSFGSCDFMLVADKKLHIVDLKYGYIEVQAKENTQMMMYALGALNLFDCLYDIEEVEMTIFQPRIQNISSWSMSVEELVKWGNEVLRPEAELAAVGEGEFNPGPWCSHNFCKARTTCRARADQMLELAKLEFKPPALLSDEELATVMDKADELSKWCSDVMTFATIQATEHGKSYPGWKVVEGRSVRKFSDTKAVEETVKDAGYTDNDSSSNIDVNNMTMEELVLWLQKNPYDEVALTRLFDDMKDAIKTIMYNFYPAFLPHYDIDDMYQEAHLSMWSALKNYKNEKGWKAKSFMELVVKRRLIRVHETYYSKNPYTLYVTDEETSEEGLVKGNVVESSFRKRNLEKKREYNNTWRIKNGLKPHKARKELTPEEKLQKEIERKNKRKAYYEANRERIREKWHNASPEEKAERSRKRKEYYRKNRERSIMLAKLYKINHPEKTEENERRYREKQKRLREEQKRMAQQENNGLST